MSYIPKIPIRDLVEVVFENTGFNEHDINTIKEQLEYACKDGNINKNKRMILFNTENGIMKIYATIWMVGKKYILLKENLYIPIAAIIDIE